MTKLSNPTTTPKSYFTEPSTEVCTKIVEITPEVAQLLVNNTNQKVQRKSKQAQIQYLTQQIQGGKWQLNGDAIRQDIEGNIIDGLHRLKACISANMPIETLFIKGLPTHAIKTIDQAGAKRTLADYISITYAESKYHNAVASSMQTIHEITQGRYSALDGKHTAGGSNKKHRIDSIYIDTFLKQHPEFFKFVADSLSIRSAGDLLLNPKSFISFHWIFGLLNRFKADDFMYKLSTGQGVVKGCPIYALRTRIIKSKTQPNEYKLSVKQLICAVYQTWNLYITGQPAKSRFSYSKVPALLGL